MVKNIFLYIYLFLTVSCVYPDIQGNINIDSSSSIINKDVDIKYTPPVTIEEESSYECLMNTSEPFIGVTEKGGNNKDFTNKELKNLLIQSGWKPGLAWCSFMVKGLLDECNIPNTITGWSPSSYNRKDVIYTDGKFKQQYKEDDVLVMSLSYNKFKNNKTRFKGIGHTGIVEEIREKNAVLREGNTNDVGGREGDGFHRKIRPLTKNLHITRWK
jgi:hypothetical protein